MNNTKAIFRYIIFVLFLGRAIIPPLWGLDPAVKPKNYLVKEWTSADGLPTDNIGCINQAPDGYIRIGTATGLLRFDGINLQRIRHGSETGYLDGWIMDL